MAKGAPSGFCRLCSLCVRFTVVGFGRYLTHCFPAARPLWHHCSLTQRPSQRFIAQPLLPAMLHPPPPPSAYPAPPPAGHGLTHGRRSHHASTASLGSSMSLASFAAGVGALSQSASNASLMYGSGGGTQRVYPFPPQPPPNASLSAASPAAAAAAASVAAGAPFPFLRLKSFSPHTHAVLKRLETAVQAAPGNPQPYLDLAEEYRVLGARGAFLRLLEYGHARFPAEPQFKTLLYSHAPNRARTPPPPEPAIAMTRTVTYDYRWRHREENLFPKLIRKLDTNVPPYGRQVRAMHLAALAILSAEDTFLSPAARAKQRAQALEAMERGQREGTDAEHAVAIVIPAGFNKSRGSQGVLPFAATPPPPPVARATADESVSSPSLTPTAGAAAAHPTTPSTGRKLLSPSKDQVRRESTSNLGAVASTLRREAASSSPPPAAAAASSSAPHTPQTPEEAQESLERQWAAEDAQREREEQEHAQARAKELAEVQEIKVRQARAKEEASAASSSASAAAVSASS